MIIEFDIDELLENKYNIKLKKYWKLPEEEKEQITDLLFQFVLVMFDRNPSIYSTYMNILNDSINNCSDFGEYEKADILTRLKNRISENFYFY